MSHELDDTLEIEEAKADCAVVCGDDEFVNVMLVLREKGVDIGLIDEFCALGLGEDEVGEGEEAKVGI